MRCLISLADAVTPRTTPGALYLSISSFCISSFVFLYSRIFGELSIYIYTFYLCLYLSRFPHCKSKKLDRYCYVL